MLVRAATLAIASTVVAAGLAAWLTHLAGPDAVIPVTTLGTIAVLVLVGTLVLGRPSRSSCALALLGAAYAVILVIDDPPLDGDSIVVGAALLAVGELAYLSVETRSAVTEEAGAVARRIARVSVLVLLALAVGGCRPRRRRSAPHGRPRDRGRRRGAAAAAVGLLVLAARDARQRQSRHT